MLARTRGLTPNGNSPCFAVNSSLPARQGPAGISQHSLSLKSFGPQGIGPSESASVLKKPSFDQLVDKWRGRLTPQDMVLPTMQEIKHAWRNAQRSKNADVSDTTASGDDQDESWQPRRNRRNQRGGTKSKEKPVSPTAKLMAEKVDKLGAAMTAANQQARVQSSALVATVQNTGNAIDRLLAAEAASQQRASMQADRNNDTQRLELELRRQELEYKREALRVKQSIAELKYRSKHHRRYHHRHRHHRRLSFTTSSSGLAAVPSTKHDASHDGTARKHARQSQQQRPSSGDDDHERKRQHHAEVSSPHQYSRKHNRSGSTAAASELPTELENTQLRRLHTSDDIQAAHAAGGLAVLSPQQAEPRKEGK